MDFRKLIVLVMLAACLPATADIRIVTRAVETSTAYMNMPTTDSSRLLFKSCDDCEIFEVRLTPATLFILRGEQLPFAEFRKQFNSLRQSKDDYALVTFDTETNAVSSVRVGE
ncbi:MAG: hypothetical protein L0Y45_02360 [Woeseiaceae bacterium]|nr:hypothetical protein [Woeseiaceae bacterium]